MARKDVIQFRVSEEEKQQLGKLAAKAGSNVSDFVRSRALEEALRGESGTPALSRDAVGEMASGVTLQTNGDDGGRQAGSTPASPAERPDAATAAQTTVLSASPRPPDPMAAATQRVAALSPKAGVKPIPKGA